MISISISLQGKTPQDLANALRSAVATLEGAEAPETTSVHDIGEIRRGRGRPPKAKTPEAEDDLSFGGEEEEEAPEAEETEEAEEEAAEEEEAPAPAKKASSEQALEKVIAAFQTYVKKNSREKAGKILAKYKVKSVRDLPKEKYSEIIKLLST